MNGRVIINFRDLTLPEEFHAYNIQTPQKGPAVFELHYTDTEGKKHYEIYPLDTVRSIVITREEETAQ